MPFSIYVVSPVYVSHKRMSRKFLNTERDKMIAYCVFLSDGGIPFTVRESENVTSGKKWLAEYAA